MAPDRAFVILLIFLSQRIRGEEIIAEEEDFLIDNVDDGSNFVRFKRDIQSQVTQNVSEWAHATKLNSSHLHLMVHWAGQMSQVMFLMGRSVKMEQYGATSKMYTSLDYGKTFTDISKKFQMEDGTNALIAKFYHHPKDKCHYVFADEINKYVFTTSNCGEDIVPHKLDQITPSVITFEENRNDVFLIHDLKDPEKRLYVTKNFGETYDVVQRYVRNFFFHYTKTETKLYVERIQPQRDDANAKDEIKVSVLSSNNYFERRIDTEVVYRDAVHFQLMKDYLFVTRYRPQDAKHLDLFISQSGERFVEARFPFSEDKNFTHMDYHIIDVTDDGQILLIVNHGPTLSNLYTSTRITPYEVQFSLSLERVMFYNPNVTWHDTWLSAVAGDKPFADVYKVDGLRGIYIASQIHESAVHTGNGNLLRSISPNDLRSLITFDGGAIWTPIKGPKTDEEGRNFTSCENMRGYECKLHLSQKLSTKFPSTRSIPIMSSSSAIGVIIASGNMGKTLAIKNNVFVSADAGLSWHQILKGSHYFNMGDHGGILVATKYYKTDGPTNELLYSTDEGINWKNLTFYEKPLKVYGLLTEPGENSTSFTIFGTESNKRGIDWIIITIDLKGAFTKNCTQDDYKRWSPQDNTRGKHRNCILGRKESYERRIVNRNCYNGREYERLITVENCDCDDTDYQCDFGFQRDDSWSKGCIKDPKFHHDEYKIPDHCPPGQFYNLTRGYIKIRGDTCVGGDAKLYEPHKVACPIKEEKEFLLLAGRTQIQRIDLSNLTYPEILPINTSNVITVEYDLEDGCLFYGDVKEKSIFKQCMNGSAKEILVKKTQTVEGMSYDWISKTLFFVDGSKPSIEVVRVDVENEDHMRKTILDHEIVKKPRGIAVHPNLGLLFYSDWAEGNAHIGRTNMDGSGHMILKSAPTVSWPNCLALDYVANRVYWVDAQKDHIVSMGFDGKNYKIVLEKTGSVKHPFGIAVHKKLMFWTDWTLQHLHMADKDRGKGVSEIVQAKNAMDVKAFSSIHRQGTNACSKNPCTHICVPLPNEKHACLCPDGLKSFNNTCKCLDGSDPKDGGTCPEGANGLCSVDQFMCKNSGRCIPKGWMCNGMNDCGDNSDETDPTCHDLECRQGQFKCADGEKCIPEYWKCDFDHDCKDGSDENNCKNTTCNPDTQFRCDNGQCITNKWTCDLENDCQDGSDESASHCRERFYQQDPNCLQNEFRCSNTTQCLPVSWKCDGDFDCPNQEDENNCEGERKCQDWQFNCGNGQCIFSTWRCDGDPDCPNGIDEQNCTVSDDDNPDIFSPLPQFPDSTQCNDWTFKCNNGQCIPYWWKCDGSKDCSDESDELECNDDVTQPPSTENPNDPDYVPQCPKDKFLCPVSLDCIWEAWLCDGENDCQDGADESPNICANRPKCDRNMFRCERSGQCVPYDQVCNKVSDCPDGSDEFGCERDDFTDPKTLEEIHGILLCGPNMFKCDDNLCVPDEKICNQVNDCLDGTDELHCGNRLYEPRVYKLEVVGDSINATSVRVDWLIDDYSQVEKFLFQPGYAPEGTEDWTYLEWQSRPDLSYTFTKLRPFTTYKFKVNLKSGKVVYNSTSMAKTTTSPAMPGKPAFLDQLNQTTSNFILKWTKPATTNGPLKNYIIEITDTDMNTVHNFETEGPVQEYIFDAGEFHPSQKVVFRVRAVNSEFKGPFSEPKEVIIGSSILEDSIQDLQLMKAGDTWAFFRWEKLVPGAKSPLYNDDSWTYRVVYTDQENHFAKFTPKILTNANSSSSTMSLNVTDLSPGSHYQFRFNIQKANLAGPNSLKPVSTSGKPLPTPIDIEGQLSPTSGTSIKLSWNLPNDTKNRNYVYGVYSGVNYKEILTGDPVNTTDTTIMIKGLHACEKYSFVVAIVGPQSFGPPSVPIAVSTKFSPGAPPKNLQVSYDNENNRMPISWTASCPVIDVDIGYVLEVKDMLKTNKISTIKLDKTKDVNFNHPIDKGLKLGTTYEIRVKTDNPNSKWSKAVQVKTGHVPIPAAVTVYNQLVDQKAKKAGNSNDPQEQVVVQWEKPKELPDYLAKDNNLHYKVVISRDPHFNETELTLNVSDTKLELPQDKLEAGRLYFVGVSLVDSEGYASPLNRVGPFNAPVPQEDIVVTPTGAAGVLVPIFIVIAVLGSALGYYMYRNRRLARNFAAYASRYNAASGTTILNTNSLDDDEDDDSPIIRGFADDEPLVVS